MEKLIVVLGPTASGKTSLSIKLAKALNTEIISGDSQLVYTGFDIGSAKPDMIERDGIIHHMIDIMPPDARYNVMDFVQQVKPIITSINQQGKIPILAGGTGLYIKALLEGYEFNTTSGNDNYRKKMENLALEKGKAYVYELLVKANPQVAETIDSNNLRRVIRALEVHELGGEQLSHSKDGHLVYNAYVAGISLPREALYENINKRVDFMIKQGLVDEIKGLLAKGVSRDCQAMKAIGYKELLPYIDGEASLVEVSDILKKNTRHFAKRQFTWYRKMPYINWFNILNNPLNIDRIVLEGINEYFA